MADSESTGMGMGMIVGILLVLVIAVLFLVFGRGYLNNTAPNTGTNVEVPDQIDVNFNPGEGQ